MANLVYRFKGPEGTFQKSTAEAVILAETGETVTPAINLAGSSMVLSIADTVGDDSINAVIRAYFGDIDYAEGQEQTTDEASVGGSKYYFGGGRGWLDEDGIALVAPTGSEFDTFLRWLNDSITVGELKGGVIDGSLSGLIVYSRGKTSGENGITALQAYTHDDSVGTTILVQSDGRSTYNHKSVIHANHHGEVENYVKVATSTESSVAFTTIPAGALGANGRINLRCYVLVKNNKGSAGTVQFTLYFGSKTVTLTGALTVNNSATTRSVFVFDVEVVNVGAANAQNIELSFHRRQNDTAENFNTSEFLQAWTTAAIDTDAAATDFKVNVTLNATDAAFYAESSGEYSGAYGTYA